MGVDKERVVVHLTGVTPAFWVVVLLPRLVTAMAMVGWVEGFAK
jgi:hypothetical protein